MTTSNENRLRPDQSSSIPVRTAIISSYAPSIVRFRGALIREMVTAGSKVWVLAPDFDAQSRAAVHALGASTMDYTISRASLSPVRDLIDLIKLSILLRKLKVDLVFCYFIKPVIYGTLAARFAGVRRRIAMIEGAGLIFTDIGNTSFKHAILRTAVSWLYKIALSQSERVIMLNHDDRNLFVAGGIVAESKVALVNGIGLDLDEFKKLPIPKHPITFIMVGRLLKEKGVGEYVECARMVKKLAPYARFILLGDVDAKASSFSAQDAKKWVDDGVLEWPGQVMDVRSWIAGAHVFILPSYREGLPRSTQEAMAIGRPVITTDVPGCRATVDEGVNGFLVPVRDATALALAAMRFVNDPSLVHSMGDASRCMAEQRYDVHKINAVILREMKFS